MTPKQAVAFVKAEGVVLESGRGPVPSLAETITGEPVRGSWWAHPRANEILLCSRAIRKSADVIVCRLVGGKVTYVHRRLWPAVMRLAGRFDADRLAAIREVHTPSGKHEVHTIVFPDWVPKEVRRVAEGLAEEEAVSLLPVVAGTSSPKINTRKPPDNALRRTGQKGPRPKDRQSYLTRQY